MSFYRLLIIFFIFTQGLGANATSGSTVTPEMLQQTAELQNFIVNSTTDFNFKNGMVVNQHGYTLPNGEPLKVELIFANGEEQIRQLTEQMTNSIPRNYNAEDVKIEHLYDAYDNESVKLSAKLKTKWVNAGYGSGYVEINQNSRFKKSLKDRYEEFKHSEKALALLRHERKLLTFLRVTGYTGIAIYTMSFHGDAAVPVLVSGATGLVAGVIAGALTWWVDKTNSWFAHSGWNTFDDKNFRYTKDGKAMMSSSKEVFVKWEIIQLSALFSMEAVKRAFAYSVYPALATTAAYNPEAFQLSGLLSFDPALYKDISINLPEIFTQGFLKSPEVIIFIAFTAFLQQGKWEEYLALYFKRKKEELVTKYNLDSKAKSTRKKDNYLMLKRDSSFLELQARAASLGLAFISIGFTSYAAGGSGNPLLTTLWMAAFGAPAFWFIHREKQMQSAPKKVAQVVKGMKLSYDFDPAKNEISNYLIDYKNNELTAKNSSSESTETLSASNVTMTNEEKSRVLKALQQVRDYFNGANCESFFAYR